MACLLTPSYTENIRNINSPPPIIFQFEGEIFFTTRSWNVIININLEKTMAYIKEIKDLIKNRQEEKDTQLNDLAMNINSLIKTIEEEIKNIKIHSKKFDKSKGRNRRGICSTCGDVLGYIFGLGTESNEEKLSKLIEKNSQTLDKIVHINSQQLSIIDTFHDETEFNNLNILNITNKVT